MSVDFDFSELNKLAADLGQVPERLQDNMRKAVQVSAHKIRQDWRAGANRTGLGLFARDITYETRETADGVVGEIGPTTGDAGSLGIVEDAPGDVRSHPQHAARRAVRKNEPDFVRGALLAAEDAIKPVEG